MQRTLKNEEESQDTWRKKNLWQRCCLDHHVQEISNLGQVQAQVEEYFDRKNLGIIPNASKLGLLSQFMQPYLEYYHS